MNWKFHKEMQSKSVAETGKSLIMIESCGLHIINGAFKDGFDASTWSMAKLLLSLFR